MATLSLPARSDFLVALDQRFRARRLDLLSLRAEQAAVAATLLPDSACIRATEWQATCHASETGSEPNLCPRPWSATATVDGTEISAATYDVGTALYDLAESDTTSPVIVHLSDVHDHREARVWNDLFDSCQHTLGLGRNRVHTLVRIAGERSCVEIDEIIYELREHIVAAVHVDDEGSYGELVSATCKRRGIRLHRSDQSTPGQSSTVATAAA